jgi:hypothetical protein
MQRKTLTWPIISKGHNKPTENSPTINNKIHVTAMQQWSPDTEKTKVSLITQDKLSEHQKNTGQCQATQTRIWVYIT